MNPKPQIDPNLAPSGVGPALLPQTPTPLYVGAGVVGLGAKRLPNPYRQGARTAMTVADRQAARDAEYAAAYQRWFATLPASEQARLTAQNLDAPDTERQTTRIDDETTLSLTTSSETHPDDLAEENDEREFAEAHFPKVDLANSPATQAGDILSAFCARIRSCPNPLLAFDAACFASGLMDLEGLSETDLAKRHRVTRSAFSRLVVQWSKTFALQPSRGMRSKRARQSYRHARLNHLAQSQNHHVTKI